MKRLTRVKIIAVVLSIVVLVLSMPTQRQVRARREQTEDFFLIWLS